MSTLKVAAIQGVSASSDAITLANDGTCTANITNSLSNRRLNINGEFQVFQRSTSATGVGSSEGYFAPDRYQQKGTGSMRYTASQSTDVPAGYGFSKSLKYDCTTASGTVSAGHYVAIEHRMEGQDVQVFCKGTAQAKQFTISFHVKSPKTGVHWVEFYDDNNDRHVCKSYTISSADTWQKVTLTFPADTTGAFGNDNGSSLRIFFWLMAGTTYTGGGTPPSTWAAFTANKRATGQVNVFDSTSNDFFITGVQLEVGSVATDFEHRSFGQELALCQRYCFVSEKYATASSYSALGIDYSGYQTSADNWMWISIPFPVTMRAAPTVDTSDGAGNTGNKHTIYTSTGGSVTNDVANYHTQSFKDHFTISNYSQQKYGMKVVGVKAEAEL
tara:strand:+ start:643 stop:1803 length:1161 start_codon:yes stop_codon:yes gene_type:complete